jgi:hypothetical protein
VTTAISGIELQNFRSFSNNTTIPLRPITLLYGQNSAGKSSVLKALLLLQQSLTLDRRHGEASSIFTFSGDSVDLGSYEASVSSHDTSRKMDISLEIEVVEPRENWRGKRRISWSTQGSGVDRLQSVRLDLDADVLEFERHPTRPSWILKRESVPTFLGLIGSNADLFTTESDMMTNLSGNLGYLPTFAGEKFPLYLQPNLVLSSLRKQWATPDGIRTTSQNRVDETGPTPADSPLSVAWSEVSSLTWSETRRVLSKLSHIGPLRQEPKRFDRYSPTDGSAVGAAGEQMLSLLHERPHLVARVNSYLSLMEMPYYLKIVSLGSIETVGQLLYLVLVNRTTGLELSPSDVGVGYSQVLPLLAQSVLARDQLVCVEQPELHLHPAMQARLGELFVAEATGGARTRFLIETHSESLMLRILRKIREGLISADEVQVLYVDQASNGSTVVHELAIDERGNFLSPWPHGFFDERLEELGI